MKAPQFRHPGPAAARITVPDQDDSEVHEIDYVRWLSQMQADLAQSLGGIMLRGARPVPIGSAAAGSNRPLSSPGRVVGWSLHETSGTNPALVRFYDGRDNTGMLLASIQVAAAPASASCNNTWFGTSGISVTEALYVDMSGLGTIEGTLYLGGVD